MPNSKLHYIHILGYRYRYSMGNERKTMILNISEHVKFDSKHFE